MPISRIEGYVIVCDECGKHDVFWANTEYSTSVEIEKMFRDWMVENGWFETINGEVLCSDCFLARFEED